MGVKKNLEEEHSTDTIVTIELWKSFLKEKKEKIQKTKTSDHRVILQLDLLHTESFLKSN